MNAEAAGTRQIVYNDGISRKFVAASVVFGLVAMLVGLVIALQLAFYPANLAPLATFGRLRPLQHTHDSPLKHNRNPVTERENFIQFYRNQ